MNDTTPTGHTPTDQPQPDQTQTPLGAADATAPVDPHYLPTTFGQLGAPALVSTAPGTSAFGAAATPSPAPKSANGVGKATALLVAAALVGGLSGFGGHALAEGMSTSTAVGVVSGPNTVTVNNPGSVNETTAIAAAVLPSVVTLDVTGTQASGSGSGVVISADGYVITNTHVVTLEGAAANATIRATTSDGRIFEATIVGTDPIYDLAVIKLEGASDLVPIEFADSAALNVGSTAVAVGAPLGLSNSVTTGIVSALNRSISITSSAVPDTSSSDGSDNGNSDGQDDSARNPFEFYFPGQGSQTTTSSEKISIAVIQTDAAINPGNSGGALVDSEGKLIGINVAIATAGSSSGESGSIGLGFAIPSNIAHRVAQEIIANGTATHGLLGAMVQAASAVEGTTVAGAYISDVVTGGAADEAGLRAGDIVTAFNGVPISNANDLTAQVRAVAGDSDATITFVRGDTTRTVDVTLGTLAL